MIATAIAVGTAGPPLNAPERTSTTASAANAAQNARSIDPRLDPAWQPHHGVPSGQPRAHAPAAVRARRGGELAAVDGDALAHAEQPPAVRRAVVGDVDAHVRRRRSRSARPRGPHARRRAPRRAPPGRAGRPSGRRLPGASGRLRTRRAPRAGPLLAPAARARRHARGSAAGPVPAPRPPCAGRRAGGAARRAPRARCARPSRRHPGRVRGRARRGAAPRSPGPSSPTARAPRHRAARRRSACARRAPPIPACSRRSASARRAFSPSARLSRERFTSSWPNSIGAPTAKVTEKIRFGTLLSAPATAVEPAMSAMPSRNAAASRRPSSRVPAVNVTSSTAKKGPAVWSVMLGPERVAEDQAAGRERDRRERRACGAGRRRALCSATIPAPASSRDPSSGLQSTTSSQASTQMSAAISASSARGCSAAMRAGSERGGAAIGRQMVTRAARDVVLPLDDRRHP